METCLNLALVDTLITQVESLDCKLGTPTKPSIVAAPKFELKILLVHLRYAYLGTNEILLVMLSTYLSNLQVEATLNILKRRKKSIGWKMTDIHGISLALCIHIIYIKENHKPKHNSNAVSTL